MGIKLELNQDNYINKKYGMLTVLKFVGYNNHRKSQWLFQCDCGNQKVLLLTEVKKGIIRSCGCIGKQGVGNGIAAFNEVYTTYRRRAFKKQVPFEINKEEFRELTQELCFYCGSSPSNKCSKSPCGEYVYNGLDRLDSSKGYTVDNVVPCCIKCNEAKMDLSPSDFYAWIEKAYLYMKKNKEFYAKKGTKDASLNIQK